MRIIVGITGATGVIYGIRLLQQLKEYKVETHLILSEWAKKTIPIETEYRVEEVEALANYSYDNKDLGAVISSGSFPVTGMIVVPCSMKTLSAISNGYSENLLIRSADVMLKEKRKLIIVPRETPLNVIHIENMLKLAKLGVTILPPMPAFYNQPNSIMDIIDHLVSRILDQFGIKNNLVTRWKGIY